MKEKEKEKPGTPIILRVTSDRKRFCNACGTELLKDYSCGKCGIYYQPEQAKHELVIKGLDGKEPGPYAHQQHIPIAAIDTMPAKKDKPMGSDFEALKKAGYKWTSYSESNT